MGLATDVADAVAAELAAAPAETFSLAFAPARRATLPAEQADLASLQVSVLVAPLERTPEDRGADRQTIEVDVVVQKKCQADLESDTAALGTVVDEIDAYLSRRPLAAYPGLAWVGSENDPVVDQDLLEEARVFASVLTCRYRNRRPASGG